MQATLKTLNLALAFFIELAMLIAIGYWGFQLKQGLFLRILAGIGLPVLVAVAWGVFLSPKAMVPLAEPFKAIAKLLLFGLAAYLLYLAGSTRWSLIFAIAVLVNTVLLYLWRQ